MESRELTHTIIGAAIEVHRELGPGLLESVYQRCMFYELQQRQLLVAQEVMQPIYYKEISCDNGMRIDLLVNQQVIVELKAVTKLLPIHKAQLVTYLRLSGLQLGLLINFNVKRLTEGVERVIYTKH
ncbi:MAG: GxxExxY protein [Idiomarina sp.]|uniref:GxxExxY protein n=1 Tax=Idiomarina sp. TaxID=1874361 RepID=UPI000C630856|nr:GxxExxY protein [Idiomarina sp.]MBT42256.1 GxxExxY protein [Idiomarina sp.]